MWPGNRLGPHRRRPRNVPCHNRCCSRNRAPPADGNPRDSGSAAVRPRGHSSPPGCRRRSCPPDPARYIARRSRCNRCHNKRRPHSAPAHNRRRFGTLARGPRSGRYTRRRPCTAARRRTPARNTRSARPRPSSACKCRSRIPCPRCNLHRAAAGSAPDRNRCGPVRRTPRSTTSDPARRNCLRGRSRPRSLHHMPLGSRHRRRRTPNDTLPRWYTVPRTRGAHPRSCPHRRNGSRSSRQGSCRVGRSGWGLSGIRRPTCIDRRSGSGRSSAWRDTSDIRCSRGIRPQGNRGRLRAQRSALRPNIQRTGHHRRFRNKPRSRRNQTRTRSMPRTDCRARSRR